MSDIKSFSIDIDVKRDVRYSVIGKDPSGVSGNDIAAFQDDIVVNGDIVKSTCGLALVDDLKDMSDANDFTEIPSVRLITPMTHEPMYLYIYKLDGSDMDNGYTYNPQWKFFSDEYKTMPLVDGDDFADTLMFSTDGGELVSFDSHTPLRHPTYMQFDSRDWNLDKVMDRLGITLSRNSEGDMCYSMDMPQPAATSGTMRACMSQQRADGMFGSDGQIHETLEVCYLFEQEDYEELYKTHGDMSVINPMASDVADAMCIADCML